MKKPTLLETLANIRQTNSGMVTYHFEDGTSIVQDIRREAFLDEKSKPLDLKKVIDKFNSIAHDLKAKSFLIG
jgi:hypothetical protein